MILKSKSINFPLLTVFSERVRKSVLISPSINFVLQTSLKSQWTS